MPTEPFDHICDGRDDWPWVLDPALQSYPPRPLIDADSAWILAQAAAELAVIRSPAFGLGDALADLHASVSLLRQGQTFLPHVVADARQQGRTWADIATQLEITPAAAQRRYLAR